jgi:hypothetical protein
MHIPNLLQSYLTVTIVSSIARIFAVLVWIAGRLRRVKPFSVRTLVCGNSHASVEYVLLVLKLAYHHGVEEKSDEGKPSHVRRACSSEHQ